MKLIVLLLVIPDVIINALIPVLVRLHAEDNDRWIRLNKLLGKTLIFISLPLSLILFIYAENVITLVYGSSGFSESIPILRIFSLILFVRFSTEMYALVLTTSQRQSARMFIVVGIALLNFVLNVYAIPHFGIQGAAIVSLISNFLAGCSYIVVSKSKLFNLNLEPRILFLCIFTIIITFLFWNLGSESFLIGIFVILFIYPITCLFIGFSSKERITLFDFRRVFNRQLYGI